MEVIQKKQVELNRAQFLMLRFYQKINQRIASWENKLTERKAKAYEWAGNIVTLDKSKTAWKAQASAPLQDAEFIFESRIVGGVLIAGTASRIDAEKLQEKYPEAYADCLIPAGQTLRLNIKK